jgi:hypothetical protein
MPKPLAFFLLATAFLYYHGKPFDQNPTVTLVSGGAVQQRLHPVPRRPANPAPASLPAEQGEPVADGYQRNLTEVRRAYRYALTDGERRATHGLLAQVFDAVKPAPSLRLAADADEITTSAYLRRAEVRLAFEPAYVPPQRQSNTARVRAFGRAGGGELGAPERERLTAGSGGVVLAALAREEPEAPAVGDAGAGQQADLAPADQAAALAAEPRQAAPAPKANRRAASERARRAAPQRGAGRDKTAARGNRLPKPNGGGSKLVKSLFGSTSGASRGRSFGFNVVGGSIAFSN